ncbi:MAG: tRNA (guanosine(37)-N1)-methyltransferase TrmD [Nitrospinae bacterium]|nr:tRNA (guanosine(37)-N1)-methyltransferase TrmD [Nitrospinota bacterium]
MEFHIISIFPGMFEPVLNESVLKRAREKGCLKIFLHDLRDYAGDRHRTTDDYPYGGGSGMVMKPAPLAAAIEAVKEKAPGARVVMMTPQGVPFTQAKALEISAWEKVILVCGRYEGVDERIRQFFVDEELSIGDYVLTGGELAAMVVVDAVSRLVPGVLGCEGSLKEETFSEPMLEYPQYTRPENFRGHAVPPVLLSGNHEEIRKWRRRESLSRTLAKRPELLAKVQLGEEDIKMLETIERIV